MRHTITAMALMILSLAWIMWPEGILSKGKDNQPSVVLKSLENEVLDEDQVFENIEEKKLSELKEEINEEDSNVISANPLQVIKPLNMEDLEELSQSELD